MKKREDGINRKDFFACIASLILVLILLFSCYLISSSPSSLCSSFYSRGESNTDTGEVVMVKTRVRERERMREEVPGDGQENEGDYIYFSASNTEWIPILFSYSFL